MPEKFKMDALLDFLFEKGYDNSSENFNKFIEYQKQLLRTNYDDLSDKEKIRYHIDRASESNDYSVKVLELNKALAIDPDSCRVKLERIEALPIDKRNISMYQEVLEDEYEYLTNNFDVEVIEDFYLDYDTRPFTIALAKAFEYLININEYKLAIKTGNKLLGLSASNILKMANKLICLQMNENLLKESFANLVKFNDDNYESYMLFAVYCLLIGDEDRAFSFLEKMDNDNHFLIYLIAEKYQNELQYDETDNKLKDAYLAYSLLDLLDCKDEFVSFVKEQVKYFKVSELIDDSEKCFLRVINNYYNEYGRNSTVDTKILINYARSKDDPDSISLGKMSNQKVDSIVTSLVNHRFMDDDGEFSKLANIFMNYDQD